jgi:U4/U6 small nuclear ribonucleoprotein PRP3
LIAQKRAEIAAKIAAMNAKKPGAVVSAPPTGMPAKPAAGIPGLPSNDELARRVAEAKKRVAEAQIRVQTPVNPHTVSLRTVVFYKE